MKKFLDKILCRHLLLKLYHDFTEDMPIIDHHNHLPPAEIAANKQFKILLKYG